MPAFFPSFCCYSCLQLFTDPSNKFYQTVLATNVVKAIILILRVEWIFSSCGLMLLSIIMRAYYCLSSIWNSDLSDILFLILCCWSTSFQLHEFGKSGLLLMKGAGSRIPLSLICIFV